MKQFHIVFYLYSTSNHNNYCARFQCEAIVFYLYSTSNHNPNEYKTKSIIIVFYLYSTSNHNSAISLAIFAILSSICILHQTTTKTDATLGVRVLSSICILHQTTTPSSGEYSWYHCLLSVFYIKPQRGGSSLCCRRGLSSICILHQTTTWAKVNQCFQNCLLSVFYIKPQPRKLWQTESPYCLLSVFYIKPQRPINSFL